MFVEDYMTPNPRTISPEFSLGQTLESLRAAVIHHLPVVDSGGRLIGIITDRDVRSAIGYDEALQMKLTVAEVMSAEPQTITADATLEDALGVFRKRRIGALPVLKRGQLVGILTRHDVIEAFFKLLGLDRPGSRVEIALPDMRKNLADAFTRLQSADRDVISAIVARTRRDGDEPSLYLRITGEDPRPIERHLSQAALIILQPEHD